MEDFNWYEDAAEMDVEEFEPVEKDRSQINKYFDFLKKVFNYAIVICAPVYVFRYIFDKNTLTILNINLNTILILIVLTCGSFNLITLLVIMVHQVLKKIGLQMIEKRFKSMYRWLSATIWFLLGLYSLKYVKEDLNIYYRYVRSFVLSGILTGAFFTGINLAMQLFYESFLTSSLLAKMKEVDIKEKIISAMKSYRYEISESSTTDTAGCTCTQIFFGRESETNSDVNISHINLNRQDEEVIGSLYFKPPEIQSLHDAKTLARDVFEKATVKKEMDFNEFSEIFPNTQIAIQAFSFFDCNDDQTISKKEFKDTMIQFYIDRVNLEKGFAIAKGFVDIVSDILSIVVCGFLILAYLVIFGIPLKDLLALALSSALVLNFAVSGMAVDLYFNFMVLLSHPFDIGDDVIVENENYTVYKIGLSTTSFLARNGGKIKFLNSVLWKKTLINMTRAPEKILFFSFKLNPEINTDLFRDLKSRIHLFLKKRSFDFFEAFSLEATSEQATDINALDCALLLKCRSYKTKAKKFGLRAEINKFLLELFKEMEIKTI